MEVLGWATSQENISVWTVGASPDDGCHSRVDTAVARVAQDSGA